MNLRAPAAVVGVAGALFLAACSSTADETTTTEAPSEPTTTTTEAPTTTTEAPQASQRFRVDIANVSDGFVGRETGAFTTPVGADEPGPALPGDAYEWTFSAAAGERLSFATMFVQSNDWIFASPDDGIALFTDDGMPVTGDITASVLVVDPGTEVDQEPGSGADQAPRQAGPDTGADDPDPTVRIVEDRVAADYVTVTLTNEGELFTLTIENTSEDADVPTPLAPGVGIVHAGGMPLFTLGEPDRGEGLEALAEDGDPSTLVMSLEANLGVVTPLAPGVAVVLDGGETLFVAGAPDTGEGLEGLAEDGDAAPFAESTGGVVFAVPSGSSDPGPLFPGQSYSAEFEAMPGQALSIATMFVQSNDWYFSLGAEGVALFDGSGQPVSGDVTSSASLWDAGTEVDQITGVGPDQAPRQAGPNTGATDPDAAIRTVDGFALADYITVTITPIS